MTPRGVEHVLSLSGSGTCTVRRLQSGVLQSWLPAACGRPVFIPCSFNRDPDELALAPYSRRDGRHGPWPTSTSCAGFLGEWPDKLRRWSSAVETPIHTH